MEPNRETAVIGMLLDIAAKPHHKVLCIHRVELVLHADDHVHDFQVIGGSWLEARERLR